MKSIFRSYKHGAKIIIVTQESVKGGHQSYECPDTLAQCTRIPESSNRNIYNYNQNTDD